MCSNLQKYSDAHACKKKINKLIVQIKKYILNRKSHRGFEFLPFARHHPFNLGNFL
jgi:hypothetical protein